MPRLVTIEPFGTTFASNGFSRFLMFSTSCRRQKVRTPNGKSTFPTRAVATRSITAACIEGSA
jgi:hypothetical protein